MDLRETGWGSVEWIQMAQDRDRWRAVVNTVMNLRVLAPRVVIQILKRNYNSLMSNFMKISSATPEILHSAF
jgi:hypothetical protein